MEDRIEFIVGDYFKIIPSLRPDVVFLSPPWGGPAYLDQDIFDLEDMGGMDGLEIYRVAKERTDNIAYFVPRYQIKLAFYDKKYSEIQTQPSWRG